MDPRTPVLVGVGQVVIRDGDPPAPEALMEAAARKAADDAGAPALLDRVGVLAVVDAMSQPLATPAIAHRSLWRSGLGGNGPQALVCELCDEIATGSLDVAVLTGAEAMTAFSRALKAGEAPPWTMEGAAAERQLSHDAPSDGASDAENAAGLIAPIFFYPLIEHAVRADAGRTRDEHLAHISALWAEFAAVAAGNPYAWTQSAPSAEEIATVSDGNRRVSDPYLKLHNSHIGVDMGAALILCSAAAAQAAGVAPDRWVFPWAGARGHDHFHVTTRADLHRSPAIRLAGQALRVHCGADYAHVDLYSCFPSAVQIAARELGLAGRPLTVTGGLTFAGGPGNNYPTHAIATLAARLREDPDAVGLATALGWYVTKHALGAYSASPPPRPYSTHDVQDDVDALPSVGVAEAHVGPGTVESFTALYERDGSPGMGIVSARLDDGRRAVAKSHDAGTLRELVGGDEPIGRPVALTAPEGFSLG